MAEYLIIRRLQRRKERIIWRIKDRSNPFDFNESYFKRRFRLSKEDARLLCEELKPLMNIYHTGYSAEMQVLQTLRILATGSFQSVSNDSFFAQTAQSTVSRSVEKTLDALFLLSKKYIRFPQKRDDLLKISQGFMIKYGFPKVIGAIDATHIEIEKPTCSDSFVFLNRRKEYSINVQMVCDANMKILDVVARWPGCSHDSFIWQLSKLREALLNNQIAGNGFLLGDNGYPLERCLLTPYINPSSPSEETFNKKHRQARNVIERCFGVLKSRFRILHETGGSQLYTPEKVCKIIICCAVLHNICQKHNSDDIINTVNAPYQGRHQTANPSLLRDHLAHYFQQNR